CLRPPPSTPRSTRFPYTTLFRSNLMGLRPPSPFDASFDLGSAQDLDSDGDLDVGTNTTSATGKYFFRTGSFPLSQPAAGFWVGQDRKSTRLNSSHLGISYAVFCL